MTGIEVRPVSGWHERRTFLTFPWRVYADDPLWVPPLLPQRSATIDPKRGVFFNRGEAQFFVAWRARQPVGTICAAEDHFLNGRMPDRASGFGPTATSTGSSTRTAT